MVLDWFESYLKNRSLIAKVLTGVNQTVESDRFDITYGTAKGSYLGPLFFIIFMNDICQGMSYAPRAITQLPTNELTSIHTHDLSPLLL